MSQQIHKLPFVGGMDQSRNVLEANRESFNLLLNMRQKKDEYGTLEQTPYFIDSGMPGVGTYYTGGASANEPATAPVYLLTDNVNGVGKIGMTSYCAFYLDAFTQIQTFYQTAAPAGSTVYTGLRLVINTVAGLAITLGSFLDVEMTGAATFRWRKNGGGWTGALVPSTAGVSIDGGNATLYFLANGGFAGTEVWAFKRLDCSFVTFANTLARAFPYQHYNRELYFLNFECQAMVVRIAATSSERYIMSVGYKPVYGISLTVFQGHLIIFGYNATAGGSGVLYNRTIASSDLNDLDCFLPTDVNEADVYTLPISTRLSQCDDGILGGGILQEILYVFTRDEVYATPYYGLPLVFSFKRFADFQLAAADLGTTSGLLVTPGNNGLFLQRAYSLTFFDGNSFRPLIDIDAFLTTNAGPRFATYDPTREEYIAIVGAYLVTYQTRYNTFYVRAASFGSTVQCLLARSAKLELGLSDRNLYAEDITWTSAAVPKKDSTGGTLWATPTVIFQPVGLGARQTIEFSTFYLTAKVSSSGAGYHTTTELRVYLKWYVIVDGTLNTLSSDAAAYWDTNSIDGLISAFRTAARALAFRLEVAGTDATKPPGRVSLYAADTLVYGVEQKVER